MNTKSCAISWLCYVKFIRWVSCSVGDAVSPGANVDAIVGDAVSPGDNVGAAVGTAVGDAVSPGVNVDATVGHNSSLGALMRLISYGVPEVGWLWGVYMVGFVQQLEMPYHQATMLVQELFSSLGALMLRLIPYGVPEVGWI